MSFKYSGAAPAHILFSNENKYHGHNYLCCLLIKRLLLYLPLLPAHPFSETSNRSQAAEYNFLPETRQSREQGKGWFVVYIAGGSA